MLHPHADQLLDISRLSKDIDVIVGPEGGWSEAECNAQRKNLVRLNTGILRADTACMAALLMCAMTN